LFKKRPARCLTGMKNHPPLPLPSLRTLTLTLATALLAAPPRTQACPNFGSMPVAASVTPSLLQLGCPLAANWPQWHLLTPGHRMPGPHIGYAPGDARPLPCVLVTWRCTNLLFVPVTVDRVRFMGYVVDQPEHGCAAGA
jgi:hypothetical protein